MAGGRVSYLETLYLPSALLIPKICQFNYLNNCYLKSLK